MQRDNNCFEHAIDVAEHAVIPKSKYAITVLAKPAIAGDVSIALRVLPPIDLDNEAMFTANKVNCVWSNWLLAHKLASGQLARP